MADEKVEIKKKDVEVVKEETPTPTPVVEENPLLKKGKKELVAMLDAQDLKYKKLRTSKANIKKELDLILGRELEMTGTVEKMAEAVALANDEAANMSEQLRIRNTTLNVVESAVRDYVQANEIATRNLQRVLIGFGINVGGK